MMNFRWFSWLLLSVFLTASCSISGGNDDDDDTVDICEPGKSVSCACPSGGQGAQICIDDGSAWGPCMCEPVVDDDDDITVDDDDDDMTGNDDDDMTGDDDDDIPTPECGDGIIEQPETCDSGSEPCATSVGYQGRRDCLADCSGWAACVGTESCGDLITNGPEFCDGAGLGGNDGCYAGSFACLADCSGYSGTLDIGAQGCGNGVQEGCEACDDGPDNGVAGKCNAKCDGLIPVVGCGDLVTVAPEACDGDAIPCNTGCYDGVQSCMADCAGYDPICNAGTQACGNGVVEGCEICDGTQPEVCNDGCYDGTATCQPDCSALVGSCDIGVQACGNGTVEGCEKCDDGADNGKDGFCNATCTGSAACGTCGDGKVLCAESCDDGDTNECTTACNATCTGPGLGSVCGDGKIECGETCDDGDADSCSAACNATCSGAGIVAVCGDGAVQCAEKCDDGDLDDCTQSCNASCTGPYTTVCGDAVTECDEICDDGGWCSDDPLVPCTTLDVSLCIDPLTATCLPVSGDFCSDNCLSDESCGNGILDVLEACDDGDPAPCAGTCDEFCSALYAPTCNNGILECGEICDDTDPFDVSQDDGCSASAWDCSATCSGCITNPGPMAFIFAGCFDMGNSFGPTEGDGNELPVHNVCLTADFDMDLHEVTNAEYAGCVDAGFCATSPVNSYSATRGTYYGDPAFADYPVIYVSWDQANEYCAWAGKRLPTEAEWEFAARGGQAGWRFPWGDAFGMIDANYSGVDTVPVESYTSNPYGLFDVAGNVWEWVSDYYQDLYYNSSPATDPTGPADLGNGHVRRGGSWSEDHHEMRVSNRVDNDQSRPLDPGQDNIGFRCAK